MNARDEISRLLERWFHLTQVEGRAIQLADWAQVQKAQAEKSALQVSLTEARQRFNVESADPSTLSTLKDPFKKTVGQLLSLEARNSHLMAEQVKRLNREKVTLEQAQVNLRRLQKSYAVKTPEVAWDSYS